VVVEEAAHDNVLYRIAQVLCSHQTAAISCRRFSTRRFAE
jgi:hypothetical protein